MLNIEIASAIDARQVLTDNARGQFTMLDIVFLFATVVFFGVAVLYARACERLK